LNTRVLACGQAVGLREGLHRRDGIHRSGLGISRPSGLGRFSPELAVF
jgi:hypothetical protein